MTETQLQETSVAKPNQRALIREAMTQFITENVECLKYRKKGETERLLHEFK
jgi:hypothetical protein